MEEKKIDKNIPIPIKGSGRRRIRIYSPIPWELMEIGDSFNCSTKKEYLSACGCSHRYGYNTGRKFTRREHLSADGKSLPGGRIWRIE